MATLERAIEIAVAAHRDQHDRAGRPYILHPLWLMHRFEDLDAMIVAVLHDTVEDSEFSLQDLADEGFASPIVEAVDALTRRQDESYESFALRSRAHPLARRVKLADLEHNLDVRRLDTLGPDDLERLAKYHRAWRLLRESAA
jgi:(p)ppGpp synthase/HD superfamily hydrolase